MPRWNKKILEINRYTGCSTLGNRKCTPLTQNNWFSRECSHVLYTASFHLEGCVRQTWGGGMWAPSMLSCSHGCERSLGLQLCPCGHLAPIWCPWGHHLWASSVLGDQGWARSPMKEPGPETFFVIFSSFLLCLLSGQLWLSAAHKRSQRRRMVSKMFLVLWHLLPAQWTSQHSASEAPSYSQACAPVQEKVKYVCEVLEGLCNADGCAQNSHACSLGHREPRWFIISSASIYYSCWRQGKVFDMYLKKLQIHKRDKFVWIVSPGV